MITTQKMQQPERYSDLLEEFFVLAGPLVGRTQCDHLELLPLTRFVMKHIGFFREIDRNPSNERELCARRWLNELASVPTTESRQPNPFLSRLRVYFSTLPRSKGSMILTPYDHLPEQPMPSVTRILL